MRNRTHLEKSYTRKDFKPMQRQRFAALYAGKRKREKESTRVEDEEGHILIKVLHDMIRSYSGSYVEWYGLTKMWRDAEGIAPQAREEEVYSLLYHPKIWVSGCIVARVPA
jgi:hypothetical protein